MITGIAYMTEVRVQRRNAAGEVLYEETLSILDAFGDVNIGEWDKISRDAFSRVGLECAHLRYEAFITYIKTEYLKTTKIVQPGIYIEENTLICPLLDSKQESKEYKIDTTLKRGFDDHQSVLETSFDAVGGWKEEHYYHLEFELFFDNESEHNEYDYHLVQEGELIYKSSHPRSDIVFDINDKGELIVIGWDANRYWINDKGELMYDLGPICGAPEEFDVILMEDEDIITGELIPILAEDDPYILIDKNE